MLKRFFSLMLSLLFVFGVFSVSPVIADAVLINFTLTADDISYGETAVVTASFPSDATGTVTFYLDYAENGPKIGITDGEAVCEFKGLSIQKHIVEAVYSGDDNYQSQNAVTVEFNVGKPKTYTATLLVDGEEYAQIPFTYGQKSITLPEVPKKEGHTGSWESYSLIAANIEINAVYEPIEYKMTFYNGDKIHTKFYVPFGSPVAHPRTPSKEYYDFAGWNPEIPDKAPAHDMEFHAVFTPKKYTATLLVDGKIFAQIPFTYGQKSIDLPEVPKKEGHTGSWESYSLMGGDVEINAVYEPNTYIATLLVDGKVYKEIPFTYGQKSITLPDVPKKEGYTGSWESYSLIAANIEINAVYEPIEYKMTFYNGDKVHTQFYVPFGSPVAHPRTPSKEYYDFAGWNPEIPDKAPAHDMEFRAVFTPKKYIATLLVDGKVYKEIPYTYGQKSLSLPDVPKKEGYKGSWESYSLIGGDIEINAVYVLEPKVSSADRSFEETVDFRQAKTYTFTVDNLPAGAVLIVYKDGKPIEEGKTVTIDKPTKDYTVECKMFDNDGNEIASSGVISVKVKNSLQDRIKWFFKNLFSVIFKPKSIVR
ncbi:MAG: InlB B-repeat-containing protein [Clostridiales bacterium]|nr:InlB B-repeat-containing protein [Clostridiales bacterium]